MFQPPVADRLRSRWRLVAAVAGVWTLVVGASMFWNWLQTEHAARHFAESHARAVYEKDIIYRRWASMHGGVYVPPTATTPPNPNLAHLPDRDVTTTGGKALTLVNPAYMTRQVHELAEQQFGIRGHLTSLNPLRPANAPDAWEASVLASFERGATEGQTIVEMGGRSYLRLMRPMMTEASCLKCHASQGYRVGQVRGGVSVSVPFWPYQDAAHDQQWMIAAAHVSIGLLGFVGLLIWARHLRRTDRELLDQGRRYGAVLQTATDGFLIHDATGRLLEVNGTYCRMSGYETHELLGMNIADLDAHEHKSTAEGIRVIRERGDMSFESQHRRKDGSVFAVEVSAQYKPGAGGQSDYIISFVRDISARRHAEAERERLREQLVHAQRLDSIGRLAGGVAHDFNNMIGVIRGYSELALERTPADSPARADLREVLHAADRSADLTRQLLAFARRQVMAPRVLDLNDTIEGMLKMLRRLIGEHIELVWHPGSALWPVFIDPAQVDQILANLCVNARDAIGADGRITIDTSNVAIDHAWCATHPGAEPGEYVRLAVRDNGCGMTPEVLAHVYEPFFTTKPQGAGTGLGLATVYGIVKQNDGYIDVASQPGSGTTFVVHLRRTRETPEQGTGAPEPAARGRGTILLVEDEPAVLSMTASTLRHLGYDVLLASSAAMARDLAAEHAGHIDLVLTDVIMPGENGRSLADALTARYPGLRVLFMSGYTSDILTPHGVLDPGVRFVQKPFTMTALAKAIRDVMAGAG